MAKVRENAGIKSCLEIFGMDAAVKVPGIWSGLPLKEKKSHYNNQKPGKDRSVNLKYAIIFSSY